MFIRQNPRPKLKALQNYFWPEMGWRRFFIYLKHRVTRLSDSPHRIALGLSFGVAASFNPYVGTHIIQACILCYIFRANIVAGALGTIVGNPSTFPLFWWLAIITGSTILGWFGVEMTQTISQSMDFTVLFQSALDDPLHILLPWSVGAYVIGLIILPISYMIFYPMIKATKLARVKLINHKRKATPS